MVMLILVAAAVLAAGIAGWLTTRRTDAELERQGRAPRPYLRSLRRSAHAVMLLAALSMFGGVIAGLVLATKSEETGRFGADENPYVVEGVALGAGGIATGIILAFVAYWALAWCEVQERTNLPRTPHFPPLPHAGS